MTFSEALEEMKKGNKARHSLMDSGDYWIVGNAQLINSPETNHLTVHKMNNGKLCVLNKYSWGIERWAVMRDDWEICE